MPGLEMPPKLHSACFTDPSMREIAMFRQLGQNR